MERVEYDMDTSGGIMEVGAVMFPFQLFPWITADVTNTYSSPHNYQVSTVELVS